MRTSITTWLLGMAVWTLIIFAIIFFVDCSFTKPEKTIVLNLAAQNSGFLLAQEKPGLAQEILKASQDTLTIELEKFTVEACFQVWVDMVMQKLELDPFLQMNFQELIKLVNIEIELEASDEELLEMLYQVIQNFVIGIEAGQ